MLFDFLDIKPLMKKICDSLDHKFLLPSENLDLKWKEHNGQITMSCPDGDKFSFPSKDVLILPLTNISAERMAQYIAHTATSKLKEEFQFSFHRLTIEVEETPGQSAIFILQNKGPHDF